MLVSVADSGAALEAMEKLLDAGMRIDESDALHATAEKGSVDGKGADINAMGSEYCAMDHQTEEAGSALHLLLTQAA